ncbi:MAG: polysaccharide deacetylase family protein [Oscillospiraceae bacterium]|jgi:peptidoglycan/xylan/chitin deacetylase (PgdA/CDA1 family)|nr:polysaccharide deacetylase family protein [Oscillospiraceae bacterium]
MKLNRYSILSGKQMLLLLAAFFAVSALLVLAAMSLPDAIRTITLEPSAKLPINCTDRARGVVSLTFDAASGDESVDALCDILTKNNITATFFVTGEWADRYAESLSKLHKSEQEIMNASDGRMSLVALKRDRVIKRINAGCDKIQAVTGKRPMFFRPNDGQYDERLLDTIKMLKMFPIGCDVDSFDIKGLDKEGIIKRVLSLTSTGSIIKFSVDGKFTVQALPEIIGKLKAKDISFIPVSQMVYTAEDYALDRDGRQILLTYTGE